MSLLTLKLIRDIRAAGSLVDPALEAVGLRPS